MSRRQTGSRSADPRRPLRGLGWTFLAASFFTSIGASGGCERPSPKTQETPTEQSARSDRQGSSSSDQEPEQPPKPPLAAVSDDLASEYLSHRAALAREITEDAFERAARLDKMARFMVERPTDDAVDAVRQAYLDVEATLYPTVALREPDDGQQETAAARDRLLKTGFPADFAESERFEDAPQGHEALTGERPAGLLAIHYLLSEADASTFGPRRQKVSPIQVGHRKWLTALTGRLFRDLRTLYQDRRERAKSDEPPAGETAGDALAETVRADLKHIREEAAFDLPERTFPGRIFRYSQRGTRAMWSGDFTRDDNSEIRGPGLRDVLEQVDGIDVDALDRAFEAVREQLAVYPGPREPVEMIEGGPEKPPDGLSNNLQTLRQRLREAAEAIE